MDIKGWKIIHLTCPKQRLKVKRLHYRILLFCGGIIFYVVHHYAPDYEVHVAVALNTMFAFDPTV